MKNKNSLAGACVSVHKFHNGFQQTNQLLFLSVLLLLIIGCKKTDYKNEVQPLIPTIISTTPCNNSSNIKLDTSIAVIFNEAMDASSINAATFIVRNDSILIPGEITIVNDTAQFLPSIDLEPNTTYTAIINSNARDKNGRAIGFNYTWHFTTKGPDEYSMWKHSDAVTDFLRDGSRSMQIGNYLYSFGGWNVPEESYNDVYRSSGDLSNWEKLSNAPWHGRHVFGIAKLNDRTYVIGGDNLHNDFDVWSTADGETWTELANHILGDRIYYGCCAHNGYLYIVGGSGYNDVWRSSDGITWTQIATNISFLNSENFAGSLISFNGRMWMVCGGGSGGGTGVARKTVWSSVDGITWRQEHDFGGTPRYYTDLCVWDNKLWVVGGYSDAESNIRSIWYMKRNGTWTEFIPPNDYIGRHATAVSTYNNKLVITCGNYNNDCWVIEKN